MDCEVNRLDQVLQMVVMAIDDHFHDNPLIHHYIRSISASHIPQQKRWVLLSIGCTCPRAGGLSHHCYYYWSYHYDEQVIESIKRRQQKGSANES
jgi:hypothetical protein